MSEKKKNSCCVWRGFAYTSQEAAEAKQIRDMPDSDELKEMRIKCYEVEKGRPFPTSSPIKLGYNLDTACMSSLEIERGAAMVELDPYTRISRKSEL